ncbi:MAG: peptidoglycan DD-metalloendopeptidase family protein [Clostridia bacterium]|nr:peptidoglycan DD-metalloendopeptidase family protein [Clostridia bacterium]
MKKVLRNLLCLWLSTLMLAGAAMTAVFAAKSDYSNNSQVKTYKNKIANLEKEQAELKSRLESVQDELYTAQQQSADIGKLIDNTNEQIDVTNALLEDLRKSIDEKQAQIDDTVEKIGETEVEIEDTKDKFFDLVRAQYENGQPSILEVIYDSDGISDMLSSIQYTGSIMDYNQKLLDKFNGQKEELTTQQTALEAAKAELEEDEAAQVEYEEELVAKQAELEYQKGVQDKLITALEMTEDEIQAEYDAARAAEAAENDRLEEFLAQLAAEEAAREAAAKAAAEKAAREEAAKNNKDNTPTNNTGDKETGRNTNTNTGGKLGWPVNKSIKYISSYYGWRSYYYRGRKVTDFHMGIDIPAAVGTDIYAAEGGTVVLSQWHYSYGNYMIVDHGGGVSTLYAHCSKLLKKVGAKVSKGDHIAEMGSTGSSTGSHLHFEVRVNGKHTNPLSGGWIVQPK